MPVQEPRRLDVTTTSASDAPPAPQPTTETGSTTPTFVAELSERVQRTRATIDSAAAAGDDDLAQAFLDDLESLVDLAAAHDVALPDTVAYLADQQVRRHAVDLREVDLRAGSTCATA